MTQDDSTYYLDWLEIAKKDFNRAKLLFDNDDFAGTGFNLQQAAEKYLKGFLLYQGWTLRKTHNLETLINEAINYEASFEKFRESCIKITQYYFESRYPQTAPSELTRKEMDQSLKAVEKLARTIKSDCKKK